MADVIEIDTKEKQAIMAQDKPEIALLISDIDNTIVDFFGMWGDTTDKAFDALCALHHLTRDELEKDVVANTPLESRMHNLSQMIATAPCLQPKNEEERKLFDKEHAKIVHEWQKGRDDVKIYEGVVATVRKLKAAGGQFVLYTDAPISAVLPRLATYGFPPELVDAIYAQPDLDKDNKPVAIPVYGKVAEWKEKFQQAGGVIEVLEPGSHKPNPKTLDRIRKERGINNPKNMAMVGDNLKADVGGANALGAFSMWQKDGCNVKQSAVDLYYRVPTNPNYLLGLEKMSSQLDTYHPDITLDTGWREMTRHVRFISKDRANGNVKAQEKNLLPSLIAQKRQKGF